MAIKVGSINLHRLYVPNPNKTRVFTRQGELHVLCVQDAYRHHIEGPGFQKCWTKGEFTDTTLHFAKGGRRAPVGNGVFSRLNVTGRFSEAYLGNLQPVPELLNEAVDLRPNGDARAKNARLLATCESKIASGVKVKVTAGDKPLWIITTHGPWRGDGSINNVLDQAMHKLLKIVLTQHGPLVLVGTSLFDRDDVMYRAFVEHGGLVDCIPRSVKNTIDWTSRGVTDGRDRVTSHILARECNVWAVELHFGLAEHAGITAYVEW